MGHGCRKTGASFFCGFYRDKNHGEPWRSMATSHRCNMKLLLPENFDGWRAGNEEIQAAQAHFSCSIWSLSIAFLVFFHLDSAKKDTSTRHGDTEISSDVRNPCFCKLPKTSPKLPASTSSIAVEKKDPRWEGNNYPALLTDSRGEICGNTELVATHSELFEAKSAF